MEQVLLNLALFLMTDFCKANNIDCAGTYATKEGRGFTYSLRNQEQKQVVSVKFYKMQRPFYQIH